MLKTEQKQKVYLGFDYGTRNIGVAIGQTITKTATPLPILLAKNGIPTWSQIAALIKQWKPVALIVGMPYKIDASEIDTITPKIRKFVETLEILFAIPVYIIDERLTTKAAREFIFDNFGYKQLTKKPIDSFAAKFILESWMAQEAVSQVSDIEVVDVKDMSDDGDNQ